MVSVIVLFILARLIGKKQLSQLTMFDYIVGISIGSIASEFAVVSSIHYAQGIAGMLVYTAFPLALSFLSQKSYRGRKVLDGTPSILIQNGRILEQNLKKSKLTINDLLEECRQKGAFDIAEIEFAVLETSGKLSVLLKAQNRPLTPGDMGIGVPYQGLCVNLIVDGQVIVSHLLMLGHDTDWLVGELGKQNISGIQHVLLAYLDTGNTLHVHLKGGEVPPSPLL